MTTSLKYINRVHFCVFVVILFGGITAIFADEATDLSVVSGTITWMDTNKNFIVIQNGINATAVRLESLKQLQQGQWVELEGKKSPFFSVFANYPGKPSASEIRNLFEGPTNMGNYYLSEMKGFLIPPATGQYRFWVASDDSSELWLSTNSDPGQAKTIAYVSGGHWTNPRQWDRFPTQQSTNIFLEAGKSYFIRAIAQQIKGKDYLGVAWEGPTMPLSVIDGQYLNPANDTARNGVLWEYWTNFFSSDLSVLESPDEFVSNLQEMRIDSKTAGLWPTPLPISPGQILQPQQNFELVDVESYLNFAARDGQYMELELTEKLNSKNNIMVRIADGESWINVPEKSYLRVRGVCEGIRGEDGKLRADIVWVNNVTNVTWLDVPDNWTLLAALPVSLLSESNIDLVDGQWTHLHGRIVQKTSFGYWQIQGDDSFYGYTSSDGTNWVSTGPPTEFSMRNDAYAGFAVSSHQTEQTAEAEFNQVEGLSQNLIGTDIGNPLQSGSGNITSSSYAVDGCGYDIWSVSDQCFFYYQPISGDRELVAHVANFKSDDPQAKACLMVRESLDSGSSFAAMVATPADNAGLQARPLANNKAAGALVSNSGSWLKLLRRRSTFFARFNNDEGLYPGRDIELIGTLQWKSKAAYLNHSQYRPIQSQDITNSFTPLPANYTSYRTVPIASMGEEAEKTILAANPPRFRICGVVTYNGTFDGNPLFLVQDASGSCPVKFSTDVDLSSIAIGQMIQLTGNPVSTTNGQEFTANGFSVVGDGTMPIPLKFPFEASSIGQSNGFWGEVEGVGRLITPSGYLLVMTRTEPLPIWCGNVPSNRLDLCINAKVRIRGICWNTSEPILLLPSARYIDILEPSPENPFDIPDSSLSLLRTSTTDNPLARRVKISGLVTCIRNNFFLIQNGMYGMQIEPSASSGVKVGETVEVVGFPSKQPSGLVLSESIIRSRSEALSLPETAELSIDDVLEGKDNGLIVSVEARIVEQRVVNGIQTLDLQKGQRVFQATLPLEDGQLPRFATGSTVRITGVSRTESIALSLNELQDGDKSFVSSLAVLLRSPGDVTVIQRPPWWNWKYTLVAIGIPVAALIGSILWIRTLRRRVEQRTLQLKETMVKLQKETQSAAILAERDRLAGEIHDSVEQGLSAIIMQMEAAAKFINLPEVVGRHLTMAKNMANFSRSEVQHAVWNLQSPMFENADLPTVLRRVAHEISAGDTTRVKVEILGTVRSLPSALEHHLLRIGQEALTNAIKHGKPDTIEMILRYEEQQLTFTVRDNGCGFNPNLPGPSEGNFGLLGIRTRARKLNAALNLTSKPNEGTIIELIVPVENASSNKPNSL
jgi:signal transduction histidine kinase